MDAVTLLKCLIVAPIGFIGKTPHSFGLPIDSNSLSFNGLVMLAVKVIGKLYLFLTFISMKFLNRLEKNYSRGY